MTLALAALVLQPAAAQTAAEDLDKYWELRERLRTEFLVVDAGQGGSLPATTRHELLTFIKWSDATVHLGWYLAVLATEHALLSDPATYPGFDRGDGDALARTREELALALAALERVDQGAEPAFWWCLGVPWVNGFFIRDDVPAGYHTAFPGMTASFSDYTDIVVDNKEMSQDQVYHLLLGLGAVAAFVPDGVVVDGRDLRPYAVEQAVRIVEYVATEDDWQIRNAVCGDYVARGHDARAMCGGTNEAVGFVSGGTASFPLSWLDVWSTFASPLNPVFLNPDNLHMAMVLAAVGDGFGGSTLGDLMGLAELQGWMLYPLAHVALHAPPDAAAHEGELVAYARAALGELPAGEAPASPRPFGPASHGWTTDNRFIREEAEHYSGGDGTDGEAYNGLDYLLLHDLLYLAYPAAWDVVVLEASFEASAGEACELEDVAFVNTSTGAASYAWQVDGVDAGSSVDLVWTAVGPGAHTVSLTASDGASTDTASAQVGVLPLPEVVVRDAGTCRGEAVVLEASGASSYTWSPASGLSADEGASVEASPDETTTYTVVGTTDAGCEGSAEVEVRVVGPAALSGPATARVGAVEAYVAAADPAATLAWTVSGGAVVAEEGASATIRFDVPGAAVVRVVADHPDCTSSAELAVEVSGVAPEGKGPARGPGDPGCGCSGAGGGRAGWLALWALARRRARR